jgi:hypothetical protein
VGAKAARAAAERAEKVEAEANESLRRKKIGKAGRVQQLKGAAAESAPTRSDKLAHVEAERMRAVQSVVMERMREEKNTTLTFDNTTTP